MTFDTLKSLLIEMGVRFFIGDNEQCQCCMLYGRSDGAAATLLIGLRPDGLLQLAVPSSFSASSFLDHQRNALFSRLLDLNVRYPLIKVGVDECDGEIKSMADIPCADTDISTEQLHMVIGSILNISDKVRGHIAAAFAMSGSMRSAENSIPPELAALLETDADVSRDEEPRPGLAARISTMKMDKAKLHDVSMRA